MYISPTSSADTTLLVPVTSTTRKNHLDYMTAVIFIIRKYHVAQSEKYYVHNLKKVPLQSNNITSTLRNITSSSTVMIYNRLCTRCDDCYGKIMSIKISLPWTINIALTLWQHEIDYMDHTNWIPWSESRRWK